MSRKCTNGIVYCSPRTGNGRGRRVAGRVRVISNQRATNRAIVAGVASIPVGFLRSQDWKA